MTKLRTSWIQQMTVEQASQIVRAVAWEGDMRVIASRLSNAGRVLDKEVERLKEELRLVRGPLTRAEHHSRDFLDGTLDRLQDEA